MQKASLLAGCCALILSLFSMPSYAESLTEVYQQALRNDPSFKEAEATWLAAKENVPIAAANLLPALDFNAGVSRIYSDLGGSTSYSNATEYALTIGQPLINFSYLANLRGAKASTKAAAATYAAAAQNLMLRTVQAYIAVMQADDDLRFTLAQKKAIHEQLINAKQKYEAGITAMTGVYQAQASYDAILATEISNRTTLATNLENLKAITGQAYTRLEGITKQIPLKSLQPKKLDSWLNTARQQNPQIKAQQYSVIAARENIKQQEAGFIPTVTANGSYSYTSASQQLGAESDKSAAIGASIDFPFYSGGTTLAQTRQARYQYVNAGATLEYTYRSVVNQTSQAFLTLLSMVSQIKADTIAIKSAEASFKATELGYVAGTQPMLNVLEDLSNVYQTRQQYAADQYTYILALVTLKQAAGTLDFNDIRQISSWLNHSTPVAKDASPNLIANIAPEVKNETTPSASAAKFSNARIKAANTALSSDRPVHYTLQVAAVSTRKEAETFIKQHSHHAFQIFKRKLTDKIWFSIGYGRYVSSEEAKQALENLSPELLKFNPWVAKVFNS